MVDGENQITNDVKAPIQDSKNQGGLIKLEKAVSHASGDLQREFMSGIDPEVDTQLRDMLYDSRQGKIACSEHEPLLL